jgi:hypothetical protein
MVDNSMATDSKVKDVIIEMLTIATIETVIHFCEESGIDDECVEILKNEQQHSQLSRMYFNGSQK